MNVPGVQKQVQRARVLLGLHHHPRYLYHYLSLVPEANNNTSNNVSSNSYHSLRTYTDRVVCWVLRIYFNSFNAPNSPLKEGVGPSTACAVLSWQNTDTLFPFKNILPLPLLGARRGWLNPWIQPLLKPATQRVPRLPSDNSLLCFSQWSWVWDWPLKEACLNHWVL